MTPSGTLRAMGVRESAVSEGRKSFEGLSEVVGSRGRRRGGVGGWLSPAEGDAVMRPVFTGLSAGQKSERVVGRLRGVRREGPPVWGGGRGRAGGGGPRLEEGSDGRLMRPAYPQGPGWEGGPVHPAVSRGGRGQTPRPILADAPVRSSGSGDPRR